MPRELPDLKVTPPVEGEKVRIVFHADGKQYELPVLGGTHGPKLIDVRRLYAETGYLTYDPGFMSTASCDSAITYIDGEAGILLHRGYPIEGPGGARRFPGGLLPPALQQAAVGRGTGRLQGPDRAPTAWCTSSSSASSRASAGMPTRWR
jgi:hypothetical protein